MRRLERREVLAQLGAVLAQPLLTPGPLPSDLTVSLVAADGTVLVLRQLPYGRDLTTWWPRWLLPKAEKLWVSDGTYDCGWPVSLLKRSEGRWMFSCYCRWLMWPRPA